LVALIGAYLASWVFLLRTSVVPDIDVLRFAVTNLTMLSKYFAHAEPQTIGFLIFVPASALLVGTVLWWRVLRGARSGAGRTMPWGRGVLVLVIASNGYLALCMVAEAHLPPPGYISRSEALGVSKGMDLAYTLRKRVTPGVGWVCGWILAEPDRRITSDIPQSVLVPRTPSSTAAPEADKASSLNCILIIVESLRADVVGKKRAGIEIMPAVTRLAGEGVLFTRCYSESVHSDYADPSISSSLYPLRSAGQYFYRAHESWPRLNIWDTLGPRGYNSALFSSQNETWSNMHLFYESKWLNVLFDSRSAPEAASDFGDTILREWVDSTGMSGKLDDELTCTAALDWMKRQVNAGQPYFAVVNFQTSHFPYTLPHGVGRFVPSDMDFPASLFWYPPEKAPIVENAYFNALHYIDSQVSRLVEFVRASAADAPTLIVITGDHGEAFHECGEVGHAQSLLETTCRVPLIFSRQGPTAGEADDYLCQSIDIAPTILQRLGVEAPAEFQGIDLFDVRRIPPEQRVVFLHSRAGGTGADGVVSASGWKLVRGHGEAYERLMFRPEDLGPEQEWSEEYPEVADILRRILMTWRSWQLTYYGMPRYHEVFCAPRTPALTLAEVAVLQNAARSAAGQKGAEPER
jgi:hypothetical protein